MAGSADLYGVAGSGALLDISPATERDCLFCLKPFDVGCGAGLDRILSRPIELTMLGQHLQRRPAEPNLAHLRPERTVQVGRGPATLIRPAQLQRGVAAEGMSERTQPGKVQPAAETLGRICVEVLQLVGD